MKKTLSLILCLCLALTLLMGKTQTENQRQCFLHIRSSSDLLRNSRLALPPLCVSSGSREPARIRSSAPAGQGLLTKILTDFGRKVNALPLAFAP